MGNSKRQDGSIDGKSFNLIKNSIQSQLKSKHLKLGLQNERPPICKRGFENLMTPHEDKKKPKFSHDKEKSCKIDHEKVNSK